MKVLGKLIMGLLGICLGGCLGDGNSRKIFETQKSLEQINLILVEYSKWDEIAARIKERRESYDVKHLEDLYVMVADLDASSPREPLKDAWGNSFRLKFEGKNIKVWSMGKNLSDDFGSGDDLEIEVSSPD